MATDDHPEYRVFWSRSEFQGSDVFEIFPGDFSGETTWQNAGSAYVREEAFAPFNEVVRAVAPRFDWYGATRLGRRASLRLIKRLEVLAGGCRPRTYSGGSTRGVRQRAAVGGRYKRARSTGATPEDDRGFAATRTNFH